MKTTFALELRIGDTTFRMGSLELIPSDGSGQASIVFAPLALTTGQVVEPVLRVIRSSPVELVA